MVSFIKVFYKKGFVDPKGKKLEKQLEKNLGIKTQCHFLDLYLLEKDLDKQMLERLGKELFADPVVQQYSFDMNSDVDFDFAILISYKPGVTDNIGHTSSEAIFDLTNIKTAVFYNRLYLIKINDDDNFENIEKIGKMLYNPLIEEMKIYKKEEIEKINLSLPIVKLDQTQTYEIIQLDGLNDKELEKKSNEQVWSLSVEELKIIRQYFNEKKEQRKQVGLPEYPTDVEIEVLAQTWSEHCKHKIFNAKIEYIEDGEKQEINSLFKTYIKGPTDIISKTKKDFLVSVFYDNGGIISVDEKTNIALKVETHNAPSALDPYGGALTGILGVNRDILGTGLGAEPIFNTDIFCVGPMDLEKIPEKAMDPKFVLEGVRKGVEDGSNTVGVPALNGSVYFDKSYIYRPLVYCGTCGIMPKVIEKTKRKTHEKIIEPGYYAVMVGGRIGADGIHGATFSSKELDENSPATAVQIGDPITQKKMQDFLLEARDLGLYEAITDNGAGGLSSSIGEMAQMSGGCEIYLDQAPLKYAGLKPWQILVSESQERMTVAIPEEKWHEFKELAKKREVEATIVGRFTNSGYFIAGYNGEIVAYIDMKFLHEGNPQIKLTATFNSKEAMEPDLTNIELDKTIEKILRIDNITSKEIITSQYDHEVKAKSIIKLMTGFENKGPQDAGAMKVYYGEENKKGIAISNGINPRYGKWDCYNMAACSIEEALRNLVAIGCKLDKIALLDNFCWTDPIKSEKNQNGDLRLGDLVRANKAVKDFALLYNAPFISGKDSMKNDFYLDGVKISILPTLLITAVSIVDDVEKLGTMDAKNEGDLIYIVGTTKDELGGSEFLNMLARDSPDIPSPKVDPDESIKNLRAVSQLYELLESCHDVSQGGAIVSIVETIIAGDKSAEINIENIPYEGKIGTLAKLFSETQSRFIVTVSKKNKEEFEEKMRKRNVEFGMIGVVKNKDESFKIKDNGKIIFEANQLYLKKLWNTGLDI